MGEIEPTIFFHSSLDSPSEWRAALATQFKDFNFWTGSRVADPERVDVALLWTVPDDGLERFVNLRAILSLGAGIDQLDLNRLPKHVPVARTVDVSLTRTMIDYAKTAVYRYHRRFHVFERQSRIGEWTFVAPTATAQTSIGILGLGEIGREIALALQREGFTVRGWSRTTKHLEGVTSYTGRDGLTAVVGRSSIVLNVLPLTDETRDILCRDLFAQFTDGACLINMGRGQHLVEADLLEAIALGKIDSATLDVASTEPLPASHPFWKHPRILITPHVAGTTGPMTAVETVATNIRRAMAGERLVHQVDLNRAQSG
ncbi:MAG: glyoxylate/hydroxypyruvate reductase A [Alphaproteobacteria bacterium]|nr:glyoxylate/hydroxypyruvate reductase A [Alphaproteobacteria bacterium]